MGIESVPVRREIWLANLGDYRPDNSSLQKGIRPVLVITPFTVPDLTTSFSCYALVMTSKAKKKLPTHYTVRNYKEIGLREQSTVLAEQLFYLDAIYFIHKLTTMDDQGFKESMKCLGISLGLIEPTKPVYGKGDR